MVDWLAYYCLIGVAFVIAMLIRGFAREIADYVANNLPPVPPVAVPLVAILAALIVIFVLCVLAVIWPLGLYDELTRGKA